MTIQAEDASLNTVTVQIKALTINKKQMTLSTFRQLPAADVLVKVVNPTTKEIDWVLRPGAVLWGFVRYQVDKCYVTNYNVVWSYNGILYRDSGLRVDGYRDRNDIYWGKIKSFNLEQLFIAT